MDTLSGAVERITFYNPENGYTVLRLRPESKLSQRFANKSSLNSDGLATVVGNLPELSPGEHLRRFFQSGYFFVNKMGTFSLVKNTRIVLVEARISGDVAGALVAFQYPLTDRIG